MLHATVVNGLQVMEQLRDATRQSVENLQNMDQSVRAVPPLLGPEDRPNTSAMLVRLERACRQTADATKLMRRELAARGIYDMGPTEASDGF